MNHSELEAFLAIAEYGSLTRAAKQLFVTQSTLSSRLEQLEKEVGARLVSRGKGIRQAELTEAGRNMLPMAERWRALYEETREAVKRSGRRALAIAAVESVQTYLLGPVCSRFLDACGHADLRLLGNDSEDTYRMVERGEAEAGLAANLQYSRKVASIPLFSESMCFICGPDSSYEGEMHPGLLTPEHEIYMKWNLDYIRWHAYWFGGAAGPRAETDSMGLLEALLARPGMWAVLPISAALSITRRGRGRILPMKEGPKERVMYLLLRNREECGEELKCLLHILKDYITECNIPWMGDGALKE